MKRFEYIQTHEEFTDYETSLDRVEQGVETIRRLTIVQRPKQIAYAYLTMNDYTEQRITVETANSLLRQEY